MPVIYLFIWCAYALCNAVKLTDCAAERSELGNTAANEMVHKHNSMKSNAIVQE